MDNRPISLLPALLASVGAMIGSFSELRHVGGLAPFERGYRRRGRKQYRVRHGRYIPGGPRANVAGTYVRNPKIAAQINAMHDVIEFARLVRQSA